MCLRSALVLGAVAATLVTVPGAAAAEAPGRPATVREHPQPGRPATVREHPRPGRPATVREHPRPGRPAPVREHPRTAPTCGDPESADFPLTTRIHSAPAAYRPGGDRTEWALDLANTTDTACRGVHPVLVLTDQARTLRPGHVIAEFFADGRWHTVPFVRTDRDELIGVFGEDLEGFGVGAGETRTVRVRLGFTEAAGVDDVVANAAIVQRLGDDGEWVGQSDDYRFRISLSADTPDSGDSYTAGAGSPHQLAQSGPGSFLGLGGTAVTFLLGGGALVAGSRRMRTPPKR